MFPTRTLAFLAVLAALWPVPAAAELSEAEVKAGFVYNFAKYTEWPPEARARGGALRVCVSGPANDFASALAQLRTRPPINGRAVEVTRVQRPALVRDCHVLVVCAQDRVGHEWIAAAEGLPILTVGDAAGFAAAGGAIGLYLDGDKLRFEVNPGVAAGAGLKLSSHLLRLGRPVRSEEK